MPPPPSANARDKRRIPPMGLNFAPVERPFIEALKLSNNGDDVAEASELLTELVRRVRDIGGKGHVTVKIAVEGIGKKVALTADLTSKMPREKRPKTAVFADENGRLGTADPDQYELDLSNEEAAAAS